MPLHTLFITNRNLQADDEQYPYGEALSQGVNRLAVATPVTRETVKWKRVYRGKRLVKKSKRVMSDTYELSPITDQSSELANNDTAKALMAQHVNELNNNRPWLLFLHGNNQTLETNLQKARRIQDLYQVNLLIYSWPSKAFDDDIETFLITAGLASFLPGGWIFTKRLAGRGLKRKIKQYKMARQNAKLSAKPFINALHFLNQHLIAPLQAQGGVFNMMTHSLGHKVLKDAVVRNPGCFDNIHFNNCILHQADEDYTAHPSWARHLPVETSSKVTITNNYNDLVLLL